jgi:soluble lytic murein transglycosylase
MHNDNKKRNVLMALASCILLSGVVCGVAVTAFSATDVLSLPEFEKAKDNALSLDEDIGSDEKATQPEVTLVQFNTIPDDKSGLDRTSAGHKIVSKAIQNEIRQSRPTYALKLLEKDPLAKKLKNSEFDRIKAMIAQSYLMEGKIQTAAKVAEQAVKRSGKHVPLAGWVAGQAAWRVGDYNKSRQMFQMTAQSPAASPWLASAGAYWAARSALKLGDDSQANDFYELAAKHPRTFYGLISLRALGGRFEFNWDTPHLSHDDKQELGQDLKVSAALRLSREGKLSAAITTLSNSKWMKSDDSRRALLAYFQLKKDPALTLFLARKTRDQSGRFYDTALYPESPWQPKLGYQVDKALIHALIRQESRFNPHAVSSTGAKGLMQIMPSTAEYVVNGSVSSLSHPETNITIGQKYVQYLLNDKSVNNDLFRMAIAYNAGPGNLARWTKELKDIDDPMVFIESIPSGETRAFVERVMVNYWIYRMRMGQDIPSLDAVAFLDKPESIESASVRSLASDQVALAE